MPYHRLYSSVSTNSLNLNDMDSSISKPVRKSSRLSETKKNASPSTSGVLNASKKKLTDVSINENASNSSFESSVSVPDTDSNDSDFFSKIKRRLPYSREEDEIILKFVLKGQNIYKVGSITLWKELEDKKTSPKRTYHSLKNRFLRNIIPLIFSKYKHLIEDEETENKILQRFPELKKKVGKKKALSVISLPERNKCKINSTVEKEVEFSCKRPVNALKKVQQTPDSNSKKSQSNVSEFGDGKHEKRIEFKNNSIYISFKKGVYVPERHSTPKMGIYEKFLLLKNSNPLVPCSQCGKLGPVADTSDKSDKSDNEEDLIIPGSSNESQNKKIKNNASKKLTPLFNGNCEKEMSNNFSRPKTNRSGSKSPSLLDIPEGEVSEGENDASSRETTPTTYKSMENQKSSRLFYEDEDLHFLYREMAARCRLLLDSEEIEDEEKEIESPAKVSQKLKSKAVRVRSGSSSRKSKPESFFVDSASPCSEAASCKRPSKSPRKSVSGKKRLLAQNMAKMLKK